MSIENRESPPSPQIFEVDISEGWDTESQIEVFIRALKKLPFYREGLLYSGFNADEIGTSFASSEGVIFCGDENDISGEGGENPLIYAIENQNAAMAVYDPAKLEFAVPEQGGSEGYKPKDETALISIIKIK